MKDLTPALIGICQVMKLSPRYWPSVVQRLCGLGALLNVVAVHSKQTNLPAETIESWYRDSIDWIRGFGMEPRALAFLGVEGFEDAEGYPFAGADTKLRNRGFSDVHGITIMAASPPGSAYWTPWFQVSIGNSFHPGIYSWITWAWENEKRELRRSSFVELLHKAASWGSVEYALGSSDYAGRHPSSEAHASAFMDRLMFRGGNVSSRGYPSKKAREAGKHLTDFLREVYPFQVLNPIHLAYKLGTRTLGEWIASTTTHGTLELFSDDRWLWMIPEDVLGSVRQTLSKHHLLTLYLPEMSRILEDYANPSLSE